MRLIGVVSTAVLSLAIAAPAYAQQEQHDQQEEQKDKPAQEKEKKAQPEKPAKQDEKKAQQQDKTAKPEERNAQQQPDKTAKPDEKKAQQQEKTAKPEERNAQQQDKNNKPEERNAQQQQAEPREQHAGGNGGGRIPDDRYKANFGQQHTFRVSQGDYNNYRFQYGGYSFAFVGAWPSDWLYTQNVYVIEIDGVYYLCNPMYPGVNIALDVNL